MTDSQRLFSNMRGSRYGEVFLAFVNGETSIEVYNSFPLNDCPQHLWQMLDPTAIAHETGAALVMLNGPRYWLMDAIGKVQNVEPKRRTFGGIEMRYVATIEFEGQLERVAYQERHVNRGALWYFDPNTTVHELTSPERKTYVMQAYCVGVDPSLTEQRLTGLGDRLRLPDGWTYRSRVLDEELRVDTTDHVATVLQDEFENSYTLVD